MPNYANQNRIVLGHLNDISHKDNTNTQFLKPVNWDPLKEAMRLLNGNAFKLYMYLLSWEGQGYYDFSPAKIARETGMSDEGARSAMKELILKGFLLEKESSGYEFYPISRTHVSNQKI